MMCSFILILYYSSDFILLLYKNVSEITEEAITKIVNDVCAEKRRKLKTLDQGSQPSCNDNEEDEVIQ